MGTLGHFLAIGHQWRSRRAASRIRGSLALWVVIALLAMGCASSPLTPPPSGAFYETYRVGAPDQLTVTILPDPRIENSVVVRPDGMISIDLVGDIPAGGRTVEEIAEDIQKRISRYKRGANVTVAVAAANSPTISILGEVGNQAVPLVKVTRVAEAIANSGGPSPVSASERKVRVIRTGGGETVVYRVDLRAIYAGDLRTNIVLTGGDIVYVPPTIFARVGYALSALLLPLNPLLGIANSVAGSAIVRAAGG